MRYIDKIYKWTLKKAGHPKAPSFLAFISFIESSIFPIPPDIILIPMILSNKSKAWLYALICTISSVAGGILGYVIGAFFFDTIGKIILETYNFLDNFIYFKNYYEKNGIWIVLGGGFTPFPYKLITVASGFFSLNFYLFVIISVLSRGLRFFIIATLLWYFGDRVKFFIEKNLGKLTVMFFILLLIIFVLIK